MRQGARLHNRTKSSAPEKRLTYNTENSAFGHTVATGKFNPLNSSITRGGQGIFHFHCLKNNNGVTFFYNVSQLSFHI